jgi:CMD domain protein
MTHSPPTINDALSPDLLNELAGIEPGSSLAALRAQRPDVARYAQGSFETLLHPADPAGLSQIERELVALRVAVLTASTPLLPFHQERLRKTGVHAAKIAAIERSPDDPAFSPRERAILRHVDLLTNQPRAATPAQLADLRAEGLNADDMVTLAQLIAFLSFQVRVLAGLRLLAEEGA